MDTHSFHEIAQTVYQQEIKKLVRKENGWQFNATHAYADQFNQFCINSMAKKMAKIAPCLWEFLDMILSINSLPSKSTGTDQPLDSVLDGLDDTYWDVAEEQEGQSQGMHSDRMDKKCAVTNIVSLVVQLDIIMTDDFTEKSYHSEHHNEKHCKQC